MGKSNKNKLKQESKFPSKKNNIIDGKNISNLLEGPLKLLCEAVEENRNVIISLRNNHKMYAKVKAFDKHCNMLIYDIKELWTEKNWKNKTRKSQERYIAQSFLRGDNIIMIVKCPSKKKSL